MFFRTLSTVTLITVVLTCSANAQELTGTLKKVRDAGEITVGYRETSVPFGFIDDKQQPVGYGTEICIKIVDEVRKTLKQPGIKMNMLPITSSNRIPLLTNGSIDIECGSTTNSVQRQQTVAFGINYFVANVTAAVKKSSGINSLADLNGKTISTTSGSTAVTLLKGFEKTKSIDVKEIYGKDIGESFILLAEDRAAAFVQDDVLLAGQIANSRHPADYRILPESLRQEPYAPMLRKGDPAFKALVDRVILDLIKTGELDRLYTKWFMGPIPPKGGSLNFPQSQALREAMATPSDKGVQ